MKKVMIVCIVSALAACQNSADGVRSFEPTRYNYQEISDAGITASRHYPTENGVCVVVKEHPSVADMLDHNRILIGCPKHEKGAIGDRKSEGAKVVGHTNHWLLLSAAGS